MLTFIPSHRCAFMHSVRNPVRNLVECTHDREIRLLHAATLKENSVFYFLKLRPILCGTVPSEIMMISLWSSQTQSHRSSLEETTQTFCKFNTQTFSREHYSQLWLYWSFARAVLQWRIITDISGELTLRFTSNWFIWINYLQWCCSQVGAVTLMCKMLS